MRFQIIITLLFILIFTLIFTTAILAERPIISPFTTTLIRHSPYLTRFSERDPGISYHLRFKQAFLKQRRRVESFCGWVWGLVAREVKPFREDIFRLRIQEEAMFVSACDIKRFSAGSEFQRHSVENRDDKNDSDDIQNILRLVDTALSSPIPSERHLVIEYLRLKLLDHEAHR